MMVAEKAADIILGNQPLPPAEVEFYRTTRAQQKTTQQKTTEQA
jgi:choline dehydrogenase